MTDESCIKRLHYGASVRTRPTVWQAPFAMKIWPAVVVPWRHEHTGSMTRPTPSPNGRGARPGLRPHTPAEWAAEWVRKFTVYRVRRFGAGTVAGLADVAAFLRFIALRWRAPEWQQEQARTALEEWLRIQDKQPPPLADQAQSALEKTPQPCVQEGSSAARLEIIAAEGNDGTAHGITPKLTLREALLKLQGVLRLKHYSLKTEEACLARKCEQAIRQMPDNIQRHRRPPPGSNCPSVRGITAPAASVAFPSDNGARRECSPAEFFKGIEFPINLASSPSVRPSASTRPRRNIWRIVSRLRAPFWQAATMAVTS